MQFMNTNTMNLNQLRQANVSIGVYVRYLIVENQLFAQIVYYNSENNLFIHKEYFQGFIYNKQSIEHRLKTFAKEYHETIINVKEYIEKNKKGKNE